MNKQKVLAWANKELQVRNQADGESRLYIREYPITEIKNDNDFAEDEGQISDVFDWFCLRYDDIFHLFQQHPEFGSVECEYIALSRLGDVYFLWKANLPIDASSPTLIARSHEDLS